MRSVILLLLYAFLAFLIVLVAMAGIREQNRRLRREKQARERGEPGLPPYKRARGNLIVFLFGTFLLFFGLGAWHFYLHHSGTPTTATIDRCRSGRTPECWGTWSVGGQSQTGGIAVDYWHPAGTRVDIHVRSGTAYATEGAANRLLEISAGIAVVIVGYTVIILRGRRSDKSPTPETG